MISYSVSQFIDTPTASTTLVREVFGTSLPLSSLGNEVQLLQCPEVTIKVKLSPVSEAKPDSEKKD